MGRDPGLEGLRTHDLRPDGLPRGQLLLVARIVGLGNMQLRLKGH